MKQKWIMIIMVILLTFTACGSNVDAKLEKGKSYITQRQYDEAIETFEDIIENDETVYDAYIGLTRAYLRDNNMNEAEDTLEDMYKVLEEQYVEDDSVELVKWVEEIKYYANLLEDNGEALGRWYNDVIPETIDLYDIPYQVNVGTPIYLSSEQEVDIYYTLDGSTPDKEDEKYTEDGIIITEQGEYELHAIAYNKIGISGEEDYTYIDVMEKQEAPTLSMDEGVYDHFLTLYVNDYDWDNISVYYTTDGTDPIYDGYYYDDSEGIYLYDGEYEVKVVAYDYNTSEYSDILTASYTINNPDSLSDSVELNVLVYGVSDYVFDEISYAFDEMYYSESAIYANVIRVDTLDEVRDEVAYGEADVVYMSAMYAEDLVVEDALAPVSEIIDLSEYDYYNNAYDAGFFGDDYYTMPVVIDPDLGLFANMTDVPSTDIHDWSAFMDAAESSSLTYDFLLPQIEAGYFLYSYYLGYGGTINIDLDGKYTIEKEPLVDAIEFVAGITSDYNIGFDNMDIDTYLDAIYNGDVTLAMVNPYIIQDYDQYYEYGFVGAMPLPNGMETKSINNVDGLHVLKSVLEDEEKIVATRMAYRYLSTGIYPNHIASESYGLPAIRTSVDEDTLYISGTLEDYEEAISSNITYPYTYEIMDVQDLMGMYLLEVINGSMTAEAAADSIIEINNNDE